MLGIKRLPDGPDHPVNNQQARDALAASIAHDVSTKLFRMVDEARADGSWTSEMQALWDELADAEDDDDPAHEARIARLRALLAAREDRAG
jgi:hypothetical protein